jgi:eukaryotic-like serine/threonine-protein kinase
MQAWEAAMIAGDMITPNLRLERLLGEGGMGSVWIANNLALESEVAIKFIVGEYARDDGIRARFKQEAALAAKVKSPHIVQVFDHGVTADGDMYIVMELLSGIELAQKLEETVYLPTDTVVTIISQAAKGLARAHAAGVIHRDIKPANIFLVDQGDDEILVKIVDFGIAKFDQTHAASAMTATGAAVGTPHFMSPEQIFSGRDVDMRTDLWSLTVVAYKCLTGELPFEGEALGAVWRAIDHVEYIPPSQHRTALPASIDAWFERAFKRSREQRFQSAREFADGLRAALPAPQGNLRMSYADADGTDQFPLVAVAPDGEPSSTSLKTNGRPKGFGAEPSTKLLATPEARGETTPAPESQSALAVGSAVASGSALFTGLAHDAKATDGASSPVLNSPTTNLKRGLIAGALLLVVGAGAVWTVHSAISGPAAGPAATNTVGVIAANSVVGAGPTAFATAVATGAALASVELPNIAATAVTATASTKSSAKPGPLAHPVLASGKPAASAPTVAPAAVAPTSRDHGF